MGKEYIFLAIGQSEEEAAEFPIRGEHPLDFGFRVWSKELFGLRIAQPLEDEQEIIAIPDLRSHLIESDEVDEVILVLIVEIVQDIVDLARIMEEPTQEIVSEDIHDLPLGCIEDPFDDIEEILRIPDKPRKPSRAHLFQDPHLIHILWHPREDLPELGRVLEYGMELVGDLHEEQICILLVEMLQTGK